MNICDTPLYHHLTQTAYSLKEKDLPAAAVLLAASFSKDASIRYLLGGNAEGEHDREYFLCVLKAVYRKCVMLSLDESINSLLILFPPKLKAVPTLPFLLRGGLKLCRSFGISLFLRSLNYENNCKAVKKRHITPDSWYCMCFAVSPKKQGKGLGSRLFKPVLRVLSEHSVPFLETHKAVNVEIYTHLGFETASKSRIPGTDIEQYSMIWTNTAND